MIVIEKKKILLPLDHGTRQYHNGLYNLNVVYNLKKN